MNKRVLIRASVVTVITIILSLALTYVVLVYAHGKIEPLALWTAAIIPLMVAFPCAAWMGMQESKLEIANLNLRNTCNELEELRKLAVLQSQLDPMTGLFNREHYFASVQKILNNNTQGALVMLDVDHFKSINDRFGHAAGDAALLAIVDALNCVLRESDIIGRIGGEEFAVFLPDTKQNKAEEITTKMARAVREIDFQPYDNRSVDLSISIGGVMSSNLNSYDEMMRVADTQMYRAKALGRNQVVFDGTDGIKQIQTSCIKAA